jgi:hypothetical protein
VFENRVVRKIFLDSREEGTGEWRKLHQAELHVLCSSQDIMRLITSRKKRWARHVAFIGEKRYIFVQVSGGEA